MRTKVPLDSIVKRAEAYKPKERVAYRMIKSTWKINMVLK